MVRNSTQALWDTRYVAEEVLPSFFRVALNFIFFSKRSDEECYRVVPGKNKQEAGKTWADPWNVLVDILVPGHWKGFRANGTRNNPLTLRTLCCTNDCETLGIEK